MSNNKSCKSDLRKSIASHLEKEIVRSGSGSDALLEKIRSEAVSNILKARKQTK